MNQASQKTNIPESNIIDDLRALISKDMTRVNEFIQSQLHSDVALIDQLGHYIVNSGGKSSIMSLSYVPLYYSPTPLQALIPVIASSV